MNESIRPMRESAERGKSVEIIFEPIRHGVRDPEGNLTSLGKQLTKERGIIAADEIGNQDAVKAIGSTARPDGVPEYEARSFVTADIYAKQFDAGQEYKARKEDLLSYGLIRTPAPYDHIAIYNQALDKMLAPRGLTHGDFNTLSLDDQRTLSHEAQKITLNEAIRTGGPDAEKWKKEVAGAFAGLVRHFMRQTAYLKNDSKVLYPSGTHGGSMEWLLQQALVWKDKDGVQHTGFASAEEFEEIGGPFDSSESYRVVIKTNSDGQIVLPLRVVFTNPHRPKGEMYLDQARVDELAEFFESIHRSDK